ncbi:hypothetical protein ACFQWC_03450 [Rossellomorea sp. GCM10028870]
MNEIGELELLVSSISKHDIAVYILFVSLVFEMNIYEFLLDIMGV